MATSGGDQVHRIEPATTTWNDATGPRGALVQHNLTAGGLNPSGGKCSSLWDRSGWNAIAIAAGFRNWRSVGLARWPARPQCCSIWCSAVRLSRPRKIVATASVRPAF